MTITFGQWLRTKLGRKGDPGFISQGELARRIGVTRSQVNHLVNSDHLPEYGTRQRIHAALGTTEAELIALGIVRDVLIQVPTATARGEAHTPTITAALSAGGTSSARFDATVRGAIQRWADAMTPEEKQMMYEYLRPFFVDRLDDYRDDAESDREEREP